MKYLFVSFFILVFGSISCVNSVGGGCELAKFENCVTFSADSGMKTIVAKNNVVWALDKFSIDDEYVKSDELTLSYKDGSDNIWDIYKVEGEWFSVERVDYQTINIKVTKNETNRPREFNFLCYRGNCWTKISVIQQ